MEKYIIFWAKQVIEAKDMCEYMQKQLDRDDLSAFSKRMYNKNIWKYSKLYHYATSRLHHCLNDREHVLFE